MSTVELPLVPSARSTNSSASSSRSRQHSAGSNNSEVSARSTRSQRSLYHAESEEEGEYDEDEQSDEGEMQEEEEPQETSGGLWDEVEHFLNKPSPNFSNLSVKASKAAVSKPQKSTLPKLNVGKGSTDNQTSMPNRPPRAAPTGTKTIDPKLLQEAFAYANQLQQMNFDDDDGGEQQQSWRSNKTKMLMQRAALSRQNSSSSSNSVSSGQRGSRSGVVSSSSSSNGVRKKKAKSSVSSAYSSSVKPKAGLRKKRSTCEESPSSAGSESRSKPKGHMDPQTLQSLVSNFQNGTTLDELRRELAASKHSMAMSRQVLQDAAQTFFQSQ
ncbi:hypothetical protein P3T76_005206 [Phytophthora citrophthora]|uniref:Uncharacterized protein n=1 Tax=Phytophthora citrophthora TaxID=4793 RepID=A0AAD9GS83_9STRA|nr:hypothetical protein P3T76_005206 [Phytophthora citrophthora]